MRNLNDGKLNKHEEAWENCPKLIEQSKSIE